MFFPTLHVAPEVIHFMKENVLLDLNSNFSKQPCHLAKSMVAAHGTLPLLYIVNVDDGAKNMGTLLVRKKSTISAVHSKLTETREPKWNCMDNYSRLTQDK